MTLPDADRSILADLSAISLKLGTNALLIGAAARLWIFDRPYGILGRLTQDLDFAVRSSNWEDFKKFTTAMISGDPALFLATSIPHRFTHAATGKTVDIIPFGTLALPNQIISWQDGNQMSVLGLDEAWRSGQAIEPAISVVSLPALVGLKLIAWPDRLAPKDLDDVVLILQQLLDSSDAIEMVYSTISDLLLAEEYEFEVAGALYLGQQIQQIFSEAAIIRIIEAIRAFAQASANNRVVRDHNRYLARFINNSLTREAWDEAFDLLLDRWKALNQGISLPIQIDHTI
jgi:predicted nucleotidyltransferase